MPIRRRLLWVLIICVLSGCSGPQHTNKSTPSGSETTTSDLFGYDATKKRLEEATRTSNELEATYGERLRTERRKARENLRQERLFLEDRYPESIRAEKSVPLADNIRADLETWLDDVRALQAEAKRGGWEGTWYYQRRINELAKQMAPDDDPPDSEGYQDREEY